MPRKKRLRKSVTPFGPGRHRSLDPKKRAKEKLMLQRLNARRVLDPDRKRRRDLEALRIRRRKNAKRRSPRARKARRLRRLLAPDPIEESR